MSAPDLSTQIEALRALRLDCASRSLILGRRELDARLLRLEIEIELRGPNTKTDAEKLAKVDKRYLAHEEKTLQLAFERERIVSEAESVLLQIQLQLAVLQRVGLGEVG